MSPGPVLDVPQEQRVTGMPARDLGTKAPEFALRAGIVMSAHIFQTGLAVINRCNSYLKYFFVS